MIAACAAPRPGRWHLTWITPAIMRAYTNLFDAGYAHSFEVWNRTGALVGGGYGVALGGAFFTESQFSRETNASKIGFTALNWHLARWGFAFNDGKRPTPTCLAMGFRVIARDLFLKRLETALKTPDHAKSWRMETDLKTIAAWDPDLEPGAPTRTHDGVPAPLRQVNRR